MKQKTNKTPLTQWHPAFYSAVRVELVDNKGDLNYYPEYSLNTKPIVIDLLVLMKSPDVIIHNEIGKIFKGHNIFEYKSPKDELNIDTFYKGLSYATLYKASGAKVNEIKGDDITITFVREGKPQKFFKQLENSGLVIQKESEGIYYVENFNLFDVQFIITKELDKIEHIWLSSLTEKLKMETAKQLVREAEKLKGKDDREYAAAVIEVATAKNEAVFEEIKKEEEDMGEALRKLMAPEFKVLEDKIAERDLKLAEQSTKLAEKDSKLAEQSTKLAEKDSKLAEKDEEIKRLKELLKLAGK